MIYYLCLVLFLLFYEIDFLINFKFKYKWVYTLTRYIHHVTKYKKHRKRKPAIINNTANGLLLIIFWPYVFLIFFIWSAFMLDINTYIIILLLIIIPNFIKSYTLTLNSNFYKYFMFLETLLNILVLIYIFLILYSPMTSIMF